MAFEEARESSEGSGNVKFLSIKGHKELGMRSIPRDEGMTGLLGART